LIRFRFGHEDLVRTRFAISPLFDLVWSTDALADPGTHSLHLPWVRAARERLRGFEYDLLTVLGTSAGPGGYVPDFISPPPTTPLAELEDELARVRSTPHDRVATELVDADLERDPRARRGLLEDQRDAPSLEHM